MVEVAALGLQPPTAPTAPSVLTLQRGRGPNELHASALERGDDQVPSHRVRWALWEGSPTYKTQTLALGGRAAPLSEEPAALAFGLFRAPLASGVWGLGPGATTKLAGCPWAPRPRGRAGGGQAVPAFLASVTTQTPHPPHLVGSDSRLFVLHFAASDSGARPRQLHGLPCTSPGRPIGGSCGLRNHF